MANARARCAVPVIDRRAQGPASLLLHAAMTDALLPCMTMTTPMTQLQAPHLSPAELLQRHPHRAAWSPRPPPASADAEGARLIRCARRVVCRRLRTQWVRVRIVSLSRCPVAADWQTDRDKTSAAHAGATRYSLSHERRVATACVSFSDATAARRLAALPLRRAGALVYWRPGASQGGREQGQGLRPIAFQMAPLTRSLTQDSERIVVWSSAAPRWILTTILATRARERDEPAPAAKRTCNCMQRIERGRRQRRASQR